jgi:ribosomal protein S18 acetylase RimI-like enzyme
MVVREGRHDDAGELRGLYDGSVYGGLPKLVEWALHEEPERMLLAEEEGNISASVYTMVCGYGNLWASYLVSECGNAEKALIDGLLEMRAQRKARNLYVFCPRQFVETRVKLISLGFVPEWAGKIGGLDHIIEVHTGTFNPNYQTPPPKNKISVEVNEGEEADAQGVASILHQSLPRDFPAFEDADRCMKRWLSEMPEDALVAECEGRPVGVLLLSREIHPVLDPELAMLCYIAVDSSHRGMGVGEGLVEKACSVLRGIGKTGLEVDVSVGNVPARIFYTKTGFYPYWYSRNYMPHDDGIFYRRNI